MPAKIKRWFHQLTKHHQDRCQRCGKYVTVCGDGDTWTCPACGVVNRREA